MGEHLQAHLGVWYGDGVVAHAWLPPLSEDANDPQKQLDAIVAKASGYAVNPVDASVRISLAGNVVISGATIDGKSREAVIRLGEAPNVLFKGTSQRVTIKFIAIA